MSFWGQLVEKLVFGRFGLNLSVFEKLLISYSCISFMKYYALRSFCINLLYFSKIHFSRFLTDRRCFSTDWNCNKIFWLESAWLDWYSIDAQLIETEKILVSKIFTNFFFMHHLCLGFRCIALFSVSILHFCSHIFHHFHTQHAYTLLNLVLNLM